MPPPHFDNAAWRSSSSRSETPLAHNGCDRLYDLAPRTRLEISISSCSPSTEESNVETEEPRTDSPRSTFAAVNACWWLNCVQQNSSTYRARGPGDSFEPNPNIWTKCHLWGRNTGITSDVQNIIARLYLRFRHHIIGKTSRVSWIQGSGSGSQAPLKTTNTKYRSGSSSVLWDAQAKIGIPRQRQPQSKAPSPCRKCRRFIWRLSIGVEIRMGKECDTHGVPRHRMILSVIHQRVQIFQ